MLRQGPIPAFVHGLIEYAAGVLFLVAPFVFQFESTPATAVSIVVGVFLFAFAATTRGPTGLVDQIPTSAHVVIDFVLAVALVVVPFLFGFSEETAPTAFFIVVGIAHLLISIGTRFHAPEKPGAGAGAVGRGFSTSSSSTERPAGRESAGRRSRR